MITAYPKIFTLGQDYIKDIFDGEVEVTEKLDGSQFAFGMINDQLYIRSKGAVIYPETAPKLFKRAVDHVVMIKCELPMNWVLYGEVLDTPKHNTLKYDRTPKNHIALFGMMGWQTHEMMNHAFLENWARRLDIDVVPKLYYGKIDDMAFLKELMLRDSYLGGDTMEGVVVKNYYKPFLLGGQPIPIMAGKLVREDFKEKNHKAWSGEKNKLQEFMESFRTEARWRKAVQHLRDNGQLTDSPKDIGPLMKELNRDLIEEEQEEIKAFLWQHFRREFTSTATKGFAEWYKLQLAERSFDGDGKD